MLHNLAVRYPHSVNVPLGESPAGWLDAPEEPLVRATHRCPQHHLVTLRNHVVDGHVPVEVVRKLLKERPSIAGITLPGMPTGSPGMFGRKTKPFVIYAVTKDGKAPTVYASV